MASNGIRYFLSFDNRLFSGFENWLFKCVRVIYLFSSGYPALRASNTSSRAALPCPSFKRQSDLGIKNLIINGSRSLYKIHTHISQIQSSSCYKSYWKFLALCLLSSINSTIRKSKTVCYLQLFSPTLKPVCQSKSRLFSLPGVDFQWRVSKRCCEASCCPGHRWSRWWWRRWWRRQSQWRWWRW